MDNRAQNLSLQNKPLSLLPSRPLSLSLPQKWESEVQLNEVDRAYLNRSKYLQSSSLPLPISLSLSQTHNVTTTLFSKLCSLMYLVVTNVFSVLFLSLLYLSLCLCYILLIIVDQIFSPSIIHSVPGSLYLFLCFLPESIC